MKPAKEPNANGPAPQPPKPPIQQLLATCPEKFGPMIQHLFLQLQNYLSKQAKHPVLGIKPLESPKPVAPAASRNVKLPPRPKTPQAQSKKTKRLPIRTTQLFADSATLSRSHSLRSLTPVKRIATPDWSESVDFTPPVVTDDRPVLDVVDRHRRLELCEYRIQMGIDERFKHPAQAKQAFAIEIADVLTKDESERAGRYEELNLPSRTPSFWPERPWDSEDGTMDEDASSSLRQRIDKLCELPDPEKCDEGRRVERPKIKRSPSVASVRKPRSEVIVSLDVTNYGTDNSETECDDF